MTEKNKETGPFSLVVSVYNEEEALSDFLAETQKVLRAMDRDYELIFVNDGSRDGSRRILDDFARRDLRVRVIHFSTNFGHEAAMIAGIDHASGAFIICMDADLQHPPACLPDMLAAFDAGYDIVSMVRLRNASAGIIKNITSSAFYGVINLLSDVKLLRNASDFFGISSRAAAVLRTSFREKIRFLRGFVQNIGFPSTVLSYEAAGRVAGKSKYSLRKLFVFSINTIVCFSDMPLKLGMYAGAFSAFLGLLVMVYTIITWARVGTPNGYATIIVLLCFMFSMLFLLLGIIGKYMSILFSELKDRPIYIVEETKNFD